MPNECFSLNSLPIKLDLGSYEPLILHSLSAGIGGQHMFPSSFYVYIG